MAVWQAGAWSLPRSLDFYVRGIRKVPVKDFQHEEGLDFDGSSELVMDMMIVFREKASSGAAVFPIRIPE